MSWNGYPNYISKALLHRLKPNIRNRDVINEINNNKENETEIFFRLPCAGLKGKQLVKHCLKKIRRCLKINVKFVVIYDTKKISFYCNVKHKVPHEQRNNIRLFIELGVLIVVENTSEKQKDVSFLVWLNMENETLNLCLNTCQNV